MFERVVSEYNKIVTHLPLDYLAEMADEVSKSIFVNENI